MLYLKATKLIRMRLKFNPTHEIFFKKCSDDRMTANIEVENTTNVIFSFKVVLFIHLG